MYVVSVAGDVPYVRIAERAGVDRSVITRWAKGSRPDVDFAIAFARAMERPPLEALVAAGFITADEAALREVPAALGSFSSTMLAEELVTRLRELETNRDSDIGPVVAHVNLTGSTPVSGRSDAAERADLPDLPRNVQVRRKGDAALAAERGEDQGDESDDSGGATR